MADAPRISIEQWRALIAVVEAGGYAQAAAALHKTQSTLSYAVQKIERLLDLKVFEIRGRKAVLTDAGQVLYRRARTLVDEAMLLERGAAAMSRDWQPEIGLAVEIIFPTWLLIECLGDFARERPETRIEVHETVLTDTLALLKEGSVDIVIGSEAAGMVGEPLTTVEFVAVAHPGHALHKLGRKITARDLRRQRRILIRETGPQREREVTGVELRWTMSNKATQLRALTRGFGYAWVPVDNIRAELASGELAVLPMEQGRMATRMMLAFSDPEQPGRDVARLAQIIRERVARECAAREPTSSASRRGRSPRGPAAKPRAAP
jgi:DNA-binding transcriptional LysR family regulator